jgi:hypothetical protein
MSSMLHRSYIVAPSLDQSESQKTFKIRVSAVHFQKSLLPESISLLNCWYLVAFSFFLSTSIHCYLVSSHYAVVIHSYSISAGPLKQKCGAPVWTTAAEKTKWTTAQECDRAWTNRENGDPGNRKSAVDDQWFVKGWDDWCVWAPKWALRNLQRI